MSKIILKIWYSCNHRCDFCHAEFNKKILEKETLKTIKKILYIKKNMKDIETILFSWGEPTIQSNFFRLLKISADLGFKTGVVTNGSMLYKQDFLKKCMEFNFCYIYLSLHGWSERVHNMMTGTQNSFDQIKDLLLNVEKTNIILSLNCVVTQNNIAYLEELIHFMKHYKVNKIKYSLLEPKGLWYTDIDNLFVSPERVAKTVISLINKYPELQIWWDGLPFCLIVWYENKISNLQTENIMYMSEIYEDKIYNTDHGIREYSDKCYSCVKKSSCYGNFKMYNEIYGDNYLDPLRKIHV